MNQGRLVRSRSIMLMGFEPAIASGQPTARPVEPTKARRGNWSGLFLDSPSGRLTKSRPRFSKRLQRPPVLIHSLLKEVYHGCCLSQCAASAFGLSGGTVLRVAFYRSHLCTGSTKTVPLPSDPPHEVVPYILPALSKVNPPSGSAPLTPLKLTRTFCFPSIPIL